MLVLSNLRHLRLLMTLFEDSLQKALALIDGVDQAESAAHRLQ